MGKHKKSKKPFQGMEHLISHQQPFKQVEEAPPLDVQIVDVQKKAENVNLSDDPRSRFNENTRVILKKELVLVVVLMSVLFLVLVGLMAYDTNYDGLSIIASKITEFLGK